MTLERQRTIKELRVGDVVPEGSVFLTVVVYSEEVVCLYEVPESKSQARRSMGARRAAQ